MFCISCRDPIKFYLIVFSQSVAALSVKLWKMKILSVNPNNYDSHREIMESTRVYRQENLWNIEYYGSLIEAYRETDPLRYTFVALTDEGNMIGKLFPLNQIIIILYA